MLGGIATLEGILSSSIDGENDCAKLTFLTITY